jgi:hypothetical protein
MAGAYDRYDPLSGVYTPADLQLTNQAAAAAAASVTASSYTKIVDLPLVKYKKYRFQAAYMYKDEKTGGEVQGSLSPWLETTFDIPNNTKPVLNLVLTPGIKSYGIKFDFQAGSEHEDVIVYESLTGAFAGEQYIVYVGTANSMSINVSSFAQRWVKVVTRDRWLDENISATTAGPVQILNADPDTTFTVTNPTGPSALATVDPKDLSGFSVVSKISWSQSSDARTAGYAIRWSTDNPSSVQNPLWEYASVSGITTTSFTATGLIPSTTYYYQVAATTPYDVVSWTNPASGTFIAQDATGSAAGALARLKSFIAIGGVTGDLFKLGTGIAQGINLNTAPTTTPTLTEGTYHGLILNKSTTNVGNNFWLTTGQLRAGNSTEFMFWDGTNMYLTGNVNATGGKFTGNVQLAIPAGGTTSGTLYAGASPTSGARVRLSSEGVFAYDSSSTSGTTGQTLSISAADGKIDARKGYIGGWTIDGTAQTTGSIYSSNTKLESSGNLTMGDTSGTLASIVRLSASDSVFRMWIGSQTASNAPFRVTKEGKLYATGAVLGTGSTIDGYATTATVTGVNTRLTTVEGAYVSSTTLSTGLATKSTTFVQGTTPTAVRAGDLWIDTANGNELKTWTGSSWTTRRDTTFAKSTDLASKLNASTYIVQSAVDNKITADASGLEIFSGSANSGLKFTGTGFYGYKNSVPTFSILSDGTATFAGTLSAATGSFSGAVTATSGSIGGFDLGSTYGDLTAKTITSVRPRIIFGSKIMLGWISSSNYGLLIGNSYETTNARFVVNTSDDTFRASIDTTATSYALEVRNAVRARDLYYITGFGQVSSSRRFKENITYAPKRYYERILDVNPAFYVYKREDHVLDELKGVHSFGMIAEDLEDAGLGYFVERDMNGQATNLLNMHELPQLLIPVVRDLKQEVLDLRSRLEAIENA